jgi:hypothetical protein
MRRWILFACLILLPALGAVVPAAAQARTVAGGQLTSGAAAAARADTEAPAMPEDAGYLAQSGSPFTYISTVFTVPALNCTSDRYNSDVDQEVDLSGSDTGLLVGIQETCQSPGSPPVYNSFWAEKGGALAIEKIMHPGDQVVAYAIPDYTKKEVSLGVVDGTHPADSWRILESSLGLFGGPLPEFSAAGVFSEGNWVPDFTQIAFTDITLYTVKGATGFGYSNVSTTPYVLYGTTVGGGRQVNVTPENLKDGSFDNIWRAYSY